MLRQRQIVIDIALKEIPFISTEKVDWKKKGTAFLKAKFTGKRYPGSSCRGLCR